MTDSNLKQKRDNPETLRHMSPYLSANVLGSASHWLGSENCISSCLVFMSSRWNFNINWAWPMQTQACVHSNFLQVFSNSFLRFPVSFSLSSLGVAVGWGVFLWAICEPLCVCRPNKGYTKHVIHYVHLSLSHCKTTEGQDGPKA